MDKVLKIMCTGEIEVDWESLEELQLTDDGRCLKQTDDNKIRKLANSLSQFGILNNLQVYIDRDQKIYCFDAHHRKKALQLLKDEGWTIPLLPATRCLAPNIIEARKLLFLKESRSSWIDVSVVRDYMDEVGISMEIAAETIDLPEFDFNVLMENDAEMSDTNNDDDVPSVGPEPITKTGDIWELGIHRIMCGNSTILDEVELLMAGDKADLILTDPPYNVDYTGKTKDALKIKNDKMGDDIFYQFLYDAFVNAFISSKPGASIYIFHADSEGLNFRKAMTEAGFKLAQCCIWVKQTMVMGRQDYQWKHEPILYGWNPQGSHHWNSDRKQTTVWNFDRPSRSELHPTTKPVDLMSYPINNSSKHGDIVLDLFSGSGSGSGLIACEKLRRKFYGMELDAKYVDVIVNRYINFCKENNLTCNIKLNGEDYDF